jgi:hypothetical protein
MGKNWNPGSKKSWKRTGGGTGDFFEGNENGTGTTAGMIGQSVITTTVMPAPIVMFDAWGSAGDSNDEPGLDLSNPGSAFDSAVNNAADSTGDAAQTAGNAAGKAAGAVADELQGPILIIVGILALAMVASSALDGSGTRVNVSSTPAV